jgi:hypothetical protein
MVYTKDLKVSEAEAKEIVLKYFEEEINQLEGADLCGAPWERVRLSYLEQVIDIVKNKWKPKESFVNNVMVERALL